MWSGFIFFRSGRQDCQCLNFQLVVVRVVQQPFSDIEDAHSTIDSFLHVDCNEIFIEYGQLLEVWFCWKPLCFLALLTNLTSIRFLMFSIVFPKTELFISSKKPFLNSFVVFAWRFVLSSRLFFEAYSTMNIFDPQTKV